MNRTSLPNPSTVYAREARGNVSSTGSSPHGEKSPRKAPVRANASNLATGDCQKRIGKGLAKDKAVTSVRNNLGRVTVNQRKTNSVADTSKSPPQQKTRPTLTPYVSRKSINSKYGKTKESEPNDGKNNSKRYGASSSVQDRLIRPPATNQSTKQIKKPINEQNSSNKPVKINQAEKTADSSAGPNIVTGAPSELSSLVIENEICQASLLDSSVDSIDALKDTPALERQDLTEISQLTVDKSKKHFSHKNAIPPKSKDSMSQFNITASIHCAEREQESSMEIENSSQLNNDDNFKIERSFTITEKNHFPVDLREENQGCDSQISSQETKHVELNLFDKSSSEVSRTPDKDIKNLSINTSQASTSQCKSILILSNHSDSKSKCVVATANAKKNGVSKAVTQNKSLSSLFVKGNNVENTSKGSLKPAKSIETSVNSCLTREKSFTVSNPLKLRSSTNVSSRNIIAIHREEPKKRLDREVGKSSSTSIQSIKRNLGLNRTNSKRTCSKLSFTSSSSSKTINNDSYQASEVGVITSNQNLTDLREESSGEVENENDVNNVFTFNGTSLKCDYAQLDSLVEELERENITLDQVRREEMLMKNEVDDFLSEENKATVNLSSSYVEQKDDKIEMSPQDDSLNKSSNDSDKTAIKEISETKNGRLGITQVSELKDEESNVVDNLDDTHNKNSNNCSAEQDAVKIPAERLIQEEAILGEDIRSGFDSNIDCCNDYILKKYLDSFDCNKIGDTLDERLGYGNVNFYDDLKPGLPSSKIEENGEFDDDYKSCKKNSKQEWIGRNQNTAKENKPCEEMNNDECDKIPEISSSLEVMTSGLEEFTSDCDHPSRQLIRDTITCGDCSKNRGEKYSHICSNGSKLRDRIDSSCFVPDDIDADLVESRKEWSVKYKSGDRTVERRGDWKSTAKLLQELSQDLERCQLEADRTERSFNKIKNSFSKSRLDPIDSLRGKLRPYTTRELLMKINKNRQADKNQCIEVRNFDTELSSGDDDFYSVASSEEDCYLYTQCDCACGFNPGDTISEDFCCHENINKNIS